MSKHDFHSTSIPSVLSIPEKINRFLNKLKRIRFRMERHFSGRDILLAAVAAVMLLVSSVIHPLAHFRTVISIAACICAAIPICLQGSRMILRHIIPLEECIWILSSVISIILKEYTIAVLILVFADLLCQAEAYCMLHMDAASDHVPEILKENVAKADAEKSRERRSIASGAVVFFALFIFAALILVICMLFYLPDYQKWLRKMLIPLMLSGPSAIIYSSVFTHFGAIYSSAKLGIQYVTDQIPEDFSRCKIVAFSKTGTVTDGRYIISEIAPVGITDSDLLRIAAIAECKSDHPIAVAMRAAAGLKDGVIPSGLMSVDEIPGKGVSALFSGHQIYVGNAGLLEDHEIWYQIPSKSGAAVHVAVDNTYRGYILISDNLRENAFEALEEMRAHGVSTMVMLTGDVRSAARTLASSLNFDMVKPELLPEEKGSAIRYLRSVHGDRAKIACVGDGIHDNEMFAESDISICLESQMDSKADINIYSPDIMRISDAYRISRSTERSLLITLLAIVLTKILLAVLGIWGITSLLFVAVFDFLVCLAAVVYALMSFWAEKRE